MEIWHILPFPKRQTNPKPYEATHPFRCSRVANEATSTYTGLSLEKCQITATLLGSAADEQPNVGNVNEVRPIRCSRAANEATSTYRGLRLETGQITQTCLLVIAVST